MKILFRSQVPKVTLIASIFKNCQRFPYPASFSPAFTGKPSCLSMVDYNYAVFGKTSIQQSGKGEESGSNVQGSFSGLADVTAQMNRVVGDGVFLLCFVT